MTSDIPAQSCFHRTFALLKTLLGGLWGGCWIRCCWSTSATGNAPAGIIARRPRKRSTPSWSRGPPGADANEIIGLLLSGAGSDPELGARLVTHAARRRSQLRFRRRARRCGRCAKASACGCRSRRRASRWSISKPPAAARAPAPSSRSARGKWRGVAWSIVSNPGPPASRDSAFRHRPDLDQQRDGARGAARSRRCCRRFAISWATR